MYLVFKSRNSALIFYFNFNWNLKKNAEQMEWNDFPCPSSKFILHWTNTVTFFPLLLLLVDVPGKLDLCMFRRIMHTFKAVFSSNFFTFRAVLLLWMRLLVDSSFILLFFREIRFCFEKGEWKMLGMLNSKVNWNGEKKLKMLCESIKNWRAPHSKW